MGAPDLVIGPDTRLATPALTTVGRVFRKPDAGRMRGVGGVPGGGVRPELLRLDPTAIGVRPTDELPRVFAVVMDLLRPGGTATLVAVADGTTTLRTSSGQFVGAATREQVSQANRQLLVVAEENLDCFAPHSPRSVAPPARQPYAGRAGHTVITVFTYAGRCSIEAPETGFSQQRHRAAPVYVAAHGVITALRTIDPPRGDGVILHPDVGGELSLFGPALRGDVDDVSELIALGSPLDGRDAAGHTALMYGADRGWDPVVVVLLSHGADPNAADRQGSTALMFAAQHGHLFIVRQLLSAGANPNARGDHGFSPLDLAHRNLHRRTADLLVSAGAL